MSRFVRPILCTALALLATTVPAVFAESHEDDAMHNGAYVRNLEFVGGRAVQLADAIPEESYDWAPMEGVRSVSQAIMHMAGANYFFAMRLGTPIPEGIDPQAMEEITAKAECVAALEASLNHLVRALGNLEDTSTEIELFGRQMTKEDLMQIAMGHVHEHFGQLIAYARSNEVVPPWSRPADG